MKSNKEDFVKELNILYKERRIYMTESGIEQYNLLTENIDKKLDEADEFAKSTKERLTHDEIFESIKINLRKDNKSLFEI